VTPDGAKEQDLADSPASTDVGGERRVEVLAQLGLALSQSVTTADVARVIVDHGMRASRSDVCTLYTLDEASSALVLIGERGCNPAVLETIQRITRESGNPVYRTISTNELLWAENDEEYAALFPGLARLASRGPRARAFWAAPLIAEGRPFGLLGMGFYEPRPFSAEERRFVVTFIAQCAEALLRARRLQAERAARALAEKLQASLSTTLRSIGDAVITTDEHTVVTMMNPAAMELTGLREGEARGRPLAAVLHLVARDTGARAADLARLVLDQGGVVRRTGEIALLRRDGRDVPIHDLGAPIRNERGVVEGVVLVCRDVTAEKRELSRKAMLADATAALAESLDYEETLARVARIAVPGLADWCAVDVVKEGEPTPKRLAIAHIDPVKIRLAHELVANLPGNPGATRGIEAVLRSGKSEIHPNVRVPPPEPGEDAYRGIVRALGVRSAMLVPLRARGRTLGVLTFVMAESGRNYTDDDLTFAEDLARRCAVALDNALLYEEQHQARHRADVASRAKDDFLAAVSHELRTPLNAIMGWATLLSSSPVEPERRDRAIATIGRNAVAMAQLIDDLLDMSRVVSGQLRLEVQPVELARVVESAVDSIRPTADAKNIVVVTKPGDTLPLLPGDPARLTQIIWNLLSNAVKFTPQHGRVEIALRRDGACVEISVRDTGKGIDPRFLPHVFDPFRQEESSSSRGRGGLGLGLAITRQLVELHRGKIEARSEGLGCGSEFIVRFTTAPSRAPVSVLRSTAPRRVGPFVPTADVVGLRVLVVDDDDDARALAKDILESCGCRVTLADSVDAALAAFAGEVPDVLLSDVAMPSRDGYDLIRAVRAMSPAAGGEVPAAALTAYARAEDRRRLLDAGFSMHVPKPLEASELIAVLTNLMRFRPGRVASPIPPPLPETPENGTSEAG
jgi:PAS domain S-box-containing protein